MITLSRHIVLLGAACLLAACATDRSIGLSPDVEVAALEELPAPRVDISYFVGPQEKLEIEVVGAESLSGTYLTDIDGKLAFPLIGAVELEGRTPSEASSLIADRLRGRYLLDPQVRVDTGSIPGTFDILSAGQVKRPGRHNSRHRRSADPCSRVVKPGSRASPEYAKTG